MGAAASRRTRIRRWTRADSGRAGRARAGRGRRGNARNAETPARRAARSPSESTRARVSRLSRLGENGGIESTYLGFPPGRSTSIRRQPWRSSLHVEPRPGCRAHRVTESKISGRRGPVPAQPRAHTSPPTRGEGPTHTTRAHNARAQHTHPLERTRSNARAHVRVARPAGRPAGCVWTDRCWGTSQKPATDNGWLAHATAHYCTLLLRPLTTTSRQAIDALAPRATDQRAHALRRARQGTPRMRVDRKRRAHPRRSSASVVLLPSLPGLRLPGVGDITVCLLATGWPGLAPRLAPQTSTRDRCASRLSRLPWRIGKKRRMRSVDHTGRRRAAPGDATLLGRCPDRAFASPIEKESANHAANALRTCAL